MNRLLDHPHLVFIFTFAILWLSILAGVASRKKLAPLEEEQKNEYGIVLTATLTLLSLLIGFAFSMALGRYDQRKNYEEAEANAIGTEYLRLDMLPAADAARLRELLLNYLDQRILFYSTYNADELQRIGTRTREIQNDLWTAARAHETGLTTAEAMLTVAGMNDVLNSQGYTQAAWWYRIPQEAWALMMIIAVGCNFLIGYGANNATRFLHLVVPLAVAVSFFLIADIDSPRSGLVSVEPQDLISLSHNLHQR